MNVRIDAMIKNTTDKTVIADITDTYLPAEISEGTVKSGTFSPSETGSYKCPGSVLRITTTVSFLEMKAVSLLGRSPCSRWSCQGTLEIDEDKVLQ